MVLFFCSKISVSDGIKVSQNENASIEKFSKNDLPFSGSRMVFFVHDVTENLFTFTRRHLLLQLTFARTNLVVLFPSNQGLWPGPNIDLCFSDAELQADMLYPHVERKPLHTLREDQHVKELSWWLPLWLLFEDLKI